MRRLWLRCSGVQPAGVGYAPGCWISAELPTIGKHLACSRTETKHIHADVPVFSFNPMAPPFERVNCEVELEAAQAGSENFVRTMDATDETVDAVFPESCQALFTTLGEGEREGEGKGNGDINCASDHMLHMYDDIWVKTVCEDFIEFRNGAYVPRRRGRWHRAAAWSLIPEDLRDKAVPPGADQDAFRRHHGRSFAQAIKEMAKRNKPCDSTDDKQLLAMVVAGCLTKVDQDCDDEEEVVYKICNVFEEYKEINGK